MSTQLLSDREREVLLLVRMGKTNEEIAELLDLSINTVKTHLKSCYRKLNVRNRMEAVQEFLRNNETL